MAARNPKVHAGNRTPDAAQSAAPEARPVDKTLEARLAKAEAEGKRAYKTENASYTIMVKTVRPIINVQTGEKTHMPQKQVVLRRGKVYETDDPEEIAAIEGHPEFGVDGRFWRLDQELEAQTNRLSVDIKKTLDQIAASSPELKAKTIALLKQSLGTEFDPKE